MVTKLLQIIQEISKKNCYHNYVHKYAIMG